jgi:hypothetical protein
MDRLKVMAPINLDDQTHLVAVEVEDIRAERLLPAELRSGDPPPS